MSDSVQANPFDPETFTHGGGLWDGKTVTVTAAVAKTEALTKDDGTPVPQTGKDGKPVAGTQVIQTALEIKGIADGGDDKERRETYSAGDKVAATPDGEGFVPKDGGGLKFHANSNIAKFSAALKQAGFDIGTLLERDAAGNIVMLSPGVPKQRFSRLVGARFVMKAEAKVGRDGKPLKDKKGYDKNAFFPVKFLGYGAHGTSVSSLPAGGGGVAVPASPLDAKATGAVLTALAVKPLTRAELVRTLAQHLAGDPDSNGIIGLVVQDAFHKGKPWKYDGVTASL